MQQRMIRHGSIPTVFLQMSAKLTGACSEIDMAIPAASSPSLPMLSLLAKSRTPQNSIRTAMNPPSHAWERGVSGGWATVPSGFATRIESKVDAWSTALGAQEKQSSSAAFAMRYIRTAKSIHSIWFSRIAETETLPTTWQPSVLAFTFIRGALSPRPKLEKILRNLKRSVKQWNCSITREERLTSLKSIARGANGTLTKTGLRPV
mmetsp:Transcript_2685/g.3917  ORF Transcript_2685/g.3917 Transcript_2685/m.3917 type:complete len:206 (+) Transcript_2685:294-911(+)